MDSLAYTIGIPYDAIPADKDQLMDGTAKVVYQYLGRSQSRGRMTGAARTPGQELKAPRMWERWLDSRCDIR